MSHRRRREPQVILPRDAVGPSVADISGLAEPSCGDAEEPCSICLEGATQVALPCGHAFHRPCLEQWLAVRPSCPNCGRSFGTRIGAMPDGEMSWHCSASQLAGHGCGTIVLHFHFPRGEASDGQQYAGRAQHAYLPNDEEGRQLLALFALAFRRRVLFGLGPSMTTGQIRPTFAIHLKTSTCGGPTRHGYPDPDYYRSALEELRAAGVSPADAPAGEVDVGPARADGPWALSGLGSRLYAVFLWLRILCVLCFLRTLTLDASRRVVLPVAAVAAACCWPGHWLTVAGACLMAFVLDATGAAGPSCVAAGAAAYAAVGWVSQRMGTRHRLGRPFRHVSRRARRWLLKSSSIRHGFIFYILLRFYHGGFVAWFGLLCFLHGLRRDVSRHHRRHQRRQGRHGRHARHARGGPVGTSVAGNASAAAGAGGAGGPGVGPPPGPFMEPLLPSRRLVGLPSVPEAIAAAGAAPRPRAEQPAAPQAADSGARAAGRGRGPMGDDDWSRYAECSSLRGRPNAAALHGQMLQGSDDLVQKRAHAAVRAMLQREHELGEEYTVFYHSYSASCLLYELQTALATLLLGYPRGGAPVVRLARRPFCEGRDALAALLELHAERNTDHHEMFRKVAISTVVSWFASGEYGRSFLMKHFLHGWFGGDDMGDFSVLLEDVLRACGVAEGGALQGLVADLLDIGDRWGLEMGPYRNRAGRRRSKAKAICPGHVLQIFVHNSVVDSVAYGALPLGKLAPQGSPITSWLARQCPLDGQARLLVHPDLFIQHSGGLVRVFTHSSSPMYGNPGQRANLLQEIERALAPHFLGASSPGAAPAPPAGAAAPAPAPGRARAALEGLGYASAAWAPCGAAGAAEP